TYPLGSLRDGSLGNSSHGVDRGAWSLAASGRRTATMARLPTAGLCGVMALISLAACSVQSGAPPGAPQSASATMSASPAAPTPAMRTAASGSWHGASPRLCALAGGYLVRFHTLGAQSCTMSVCHGAVFNVQRSFSLVPELHY